MWQTIWQHYINITSAIFREDRMFCSDNQKEIRGSNCKNITLQQKHKNHAKTARRGKVEG